MNEENEYDEEAWQCDIYTYDWDGDSEAAEQAENQDFAQDGEFENMEAGDIL